MTSFSLICLKVVKRGGLVINHSLRSHTSGVSVIFYFLLYMLQNKQFHTHSLCSVMSRCIICISNNVDYHSLYSILNFHWLIYLQITACKYRSAANNWCKYVIEHAHFKNDSSSFK